MSCRRESGNEQFQARFSRCEICCSRGLTLGSGSRLSHCPKNLCGNGRQWLLGCCLIGKGIQPCGRFYIANWVEAHEVPEAQPPTELIFGRGTDGNVYLDGRAVNISLLP